MKDVNLWNLFSGLSQYERETVMKMLDNSTDRMIEQKRLTDEELGEHLDDIIIASKSLSVPSKYYDDQDESIG